MNMIFAIVIIIFCVVTGVGMFLWGREIQKIWKDMPKRIDEAIDLTIKIIEKEK